MTRPDLEAIERKFVAAARGANRWPFYSKTDRAYLIHRRACDQRRVSRHDVCGVGVRHIECPKCAVFSDAFLSIAIWKDKRVTQELLLYLIRKFELHDFLTEARP